MPRALVVVAAWILTVLPAREALAIQSHGGAEGLYVHQIGHLLFLGMAVVLALRLRGNPELSSRGWRCIKASCLLFALWNAMAFVGHCLEEVMPVGVFVGGTNPWSWVLADAPQWKALLFYTCKLDHLLAVPAMFLFLQGLRALDKENP
ncbi:hypothetical protein [Desulfolutivibrio sulfoxidireducens]|uniref:hypothetical protein n=1 Tax=Desulfolutivibrio sulfoxidireducens TaxID=2773299 RepID=UPI00159DB146|nr:hypothetical protein [Desulfolutivibrio sulfoxidireducens]QLA15862.1 hypothetical protein GD605_06735 [Desulfolutivibrio sulfoxidireducens]QLA20236.1 hypothetical protein GD604_11165 [Desulfolutivibrio sulfoxidireducens]